MKVESPGLDKQVLISLLQTAYSLDVARLEFVPRGEESYSYIATTPTGRTYFVKIHLAAASPELEACYNFVSHLRIHQGCEWVVSPYRVREGKCLATLGNYSVAVFDYVPGVTRAPSELTGRQVERVAQQLATLHQALPLALSSGLPKESYAISFKSWLMEVLDAVEQPLRTNHPWSQLAYDLIRCEKPQILRIVARLEEIGALLQTTDEPQFVTHGDLASHNMIEDEQGNLLMIDWGKLCISPVARDLVGLWEDGNTLLLAAYFRKAGGFSTLLKQTLTYYLYYYLLVMITDYGSWLILEEASQEEVEHAWASLQQALPLNFQQVETKSEAIYQLAQNTHKA